MSCPTAALERLIDEHRALVSHDGRAQVGCSDWLLRQSKQIDRLQAQVLALRTRIVLQTTEFAWASQSHTRGEEPALAPAQVAVVSQHGKVC